MPLKVLSLSLKAVVAAAAVKPLNAMGNLPSPLNVIRSIHTYAQILSHKEIDVLTPNIYRAEKKSFYVVVRMLHTS